MGWGPASGHSDKQAAYAGRVSFSADSPSATRGPIEAEDRSPHRINRREHDPPPPARSYDHARDPHRRQRNRPFSYAASTQAHRGSGIHRGRPVRRRPRGGDIRGLDRRGRGTRGGTCGPGWRRVPSCTGPGGSRPGRHRRRCGRPRPGRPEHDPGRGADVEDVVREEPAPGMMRKEDPGPSPIPRGEPSPTNTPVATEHVER